VYENEPAEKKMLCNKPRPIASTFLSLKRIRNKYRTRGGITIGVLFVYQLTYKMEQRTTQTMVFTTLVFFSDVILSLVNRSFYYSVLPL
jgi:Ca2+-transporting ATPase